MPTEKITRETKRYDSPNEERTVTREKRETKTVEREPREVREETVVEEED
jgi:hypothetical protein